MSSRRRQSEQKRQTPVPVWLVVVAAVLGLTFNVAAQGPALGPGSPPPDSAPLVAPPAQTAPSRNPGFLEVFGRWVDESIAGFNKGVNSTWGTGSAATKGTADAIGRLGTTRVVSGREVCATAPNGAPDCRLAAETLCKAKGYSTGNSVDYVTAEKCSAQAYQGGRMPVAGECPLEHVVTRALCQ